MLHTYCSFIQVAEHPAFDPTMHLHTYTSVSYASFVALGAITPQREVRRG